MKSSITLVFAIGLLAAVALLPTAMGQDDNGTGVASPTTFTVITNYAVQIQTFVNLRKSVICLLIVDHNVVGISTSMEGCLRYAALADSNGLVDESFVFQSNVFVAGNFGLIVTNVDATRVIVQNGVLLFVEQTNALVLFLQALRDAAAQFNGLVYTIVKDGILGGLALILLGGFLG